MTEPQQIEVTPETNPEAFTAANKDEARIGFCEEFKLDPDTNTAGDVIQHIMNVSGHQITIAQLLEASMLMGADIQLTVTEDEELAVPIVRNKRQKGIE